MKVLVTQKRSVIRCTQRQRQTIYGLGLKRINMSSELELTPAIEGMIEKVRHLVMVQKLD